ncbi:hypothetical protein [Pseudomonas shirazensis]
MDNNITINLTDAYRIKIEKSNEFEDSIFSSVYKNAKENLLEILYDAEKNSSNDNSSEKSIINNSFNNIICFVGERGQGKSSSMISFLRGLTEKKKNDVFFIEDTIVNTAFTTIDLIDPSLFKGKETLIEIILAKMFSKFKYSLENNSTIIQDDDRRKLVNLFQQVFENLKYINNRDGIYTEDSLDSLIKLSTSSNLKESFEELVTKFLQVMSKDKSKFLVIAVDDFDLKTEGVHDMLEDIRRFLISKNIILLIACNLEQLKQSIKANIYSEFLKQVGNNVSILNNIVNSSEITGKATKYIEKLIPENRRINLPELSRLDLKKILIKDNSCSESANSLVLETLYERLNLFLKEEEYEESILLKSTLRNLISLLVKIKKSDSVNKYNFEEYNFALLQFQNYIGDFLLNFMTFEEIDYIISSTNNLLNYRILQTLLKKFDKIIPEELIDAKNYEIFQNGDLYAVFYKIDLEILDNNPNYRWYQSLKLLYIFKQLNDREFFNIDNKLDTFNRSSLINVRLFSADFKKLPNSKDWFVFIDNSKTIAKKINDLPIDDKVIFASFIESLGTIPSKYRKLGDDIFNIALGSGNNGISTLHFSLFSFFTAPYILKHKMKSNYDCNDEEIKKIEVYYIKWRQSKFYYLFNNVDFVAEFYNEVIIVYDWLSRNSHLKNRSYYDFLVVFFNKGIQRIFNNLNVKYPYLKISIEDYQDSFIYAKLITEERPALRELIDQISNSSLGSNITQASPEINNEIIENGNQTKTKELKELINFLEKNKSKSINKETLRTYVSKISDPFRKDILKETYFKSLFKSTDKNALKNRENLIVSLKEVLEILNHNG